MTRQHRLWIVATTFLCVAGPLAIAACGPATTEPQSPAGQSTSEPTSGAAAPSAAASAEPAVSATASPSQSAPDAADSAMPHLECRLPAPVKSGDACKTDADCGVSDPCHARACVAKAKSNPPTSTTACTRRRDCASADANPCVCFQGVCALVPPAP